MKFKVFPFLLSMFILTNGYSQVIEASTTKEYAFILSNGYSQVIEPIALEFKDYQLQFVKIGDKYYKSEIGMGNAEFYRIPTISKKKFVLTIHQYDKDLTEKKVFSFENGESNSGPHLPYLFPFKNKLCIIHSKYDEVNGVRMFLSRINTNDMTLDATKEIKTATFGKDYNVNYSPDSSKILLTIYSEKKLFSCVIDDILNITQSTILSVPDKLKFEVVSTCLDKNGNKYFVYTYREKLLDDYPKSGIGVEKKDGKLTFDDFITSKLALDMYVPEIKNAKDGSKVYLQGSYALENFKDGFYDGIALISFDPTNAQMDKPRLFPYPDDLKQKLYKGDMANKKKGIISVLRAKYQLSELDNGTIALSGYLGKIEQITGSVMAIFITKDNKVTFSMVPRSQRGWTIPTVFAMPYNNKLIVVYATSEKNLKKDITEEPSSEVYHYDLCMAAATFDEKGNLQDRKLILQKPGKDRYYALNMCQNYSQNCFAIPIIKDRVNMKEFYKEFYGFVDLKVK